MAALRLLALVPKDLTSLEIAQVMTGLYQKIAEWMETPVQIDDSAGWYHNEFTRCGSWDAWVWETVGGRTYGSRKFNFDGFVICGPTELGRANGSIAQLALRNSRPVLHWDMTSSKLSAVVDVNELDLNNWTAGWHARIAPLQ